MRKGTKAAECSPQPFPTTYKSLVPKLIIKPLGCYIVYIFSLTAKSKDLV